MIRNYFKLTFRSFLRHKVFTAINLLGLSVGISASLVIYLVVHLRTFRTANANPVSALRSE